MKRKKIVTIGGGTGSFMLLSGLKKYPVDLSAIVSMADDGGSTGILRDELGVLPPGDVRQCLVALSDSSDILRKLINYRFDNGGLKGHNFGNLLLSALEKINGSFAKGVEDAAEILDVKGEVIPVSENQMRLHIRLKNGKILAGENHLDHNQGIRSSGIEKVFLDPEVRAYKKAVDRIKSADFIVIGPGDLYGSIIPNFLVGGFSEAVRKSRAKVIFNCNLTNKKGQTGNFFLEDYVSEIEKHIGKGRMDFVTFNKKKLPAKLIEKYEQIEGVGSIVKIRDEKSPRSYRIVSADILQENEVKKAKGDNISKTRSFIRHNSEKLARVLSVVFEMGEYESIIKEII
ncbi:MAG: gluconeogenesis factor YvcK family protein [Parcubacteria group bacterium]